MSGLGDAVAELAQHDDWNSRTRLPAQDFADASISVHERGERVGVQDHARSSGSMTSKASSIRA